MLAFVVDRGPLPLTVLAASFVTVDDFLARDESFSLFRIPDSTSKSRELVGCVESCHSSFTPLGDISLSIRARVGEIVLAVVMGVFLLPLVAFQWMLFERQGGLCVGNIELMKIRYLGVNSAGRSALILDRSPLVAGRFSHSNSLLRWNAKSLLSQIVGLAKRGAWRMCLMSINFLLKERAGSTLGLFKLCHRAWEFSPPF